MAHMMASSTMASFHRSRALTTLLPVTGDWMGVGSGMALGGFVSSGQTRGSPPFWRQLFWRLAWALSPVWQEWPSDQPHQEVQKHNQADKDQDSGPDRQHDGRSAHGPAEPLSNPPNGEAGNSKDQKPEERIYDSTTTIYCWFRHNLITFVYLFNRTFQS